MIILYIVMYRMPLQETQVPGTSREPNLCYRFICGRKNVTYCNIQLFLIKCFGKYAILQLFPINTPLFYICHLLKGCTLYMACPYSTQISSLSRCPYKAPEMCRIWHLLYMMGPPFTFLRGWL